MNNFILPVLLLIDEHFFAVDIQVLEFYHDVSTALRELVPIVVAF